MFEKREISLILQCQLDIFLNPKLFHENINRVL